MALPTFIIAGAPKCGTTALWAYLNEHPDVFMTHVKEPRFFSAMEGELENGIIGAGPNRSGMYHKGMAWYESLFAGSNGARARGEASTYYFSALDSPELIHKHIPSVKLIILLRDPVKRLYSHLWQESKLGYQFPEFEIMVQESHPRLQYYEFVSHYRTHLERYLSFFPKEHILVLLDTELRDNPLEAFRRVSGFIGLDKAFLPVSIGRTFNQQTQPRSRSLERLLTFARSTRIRSLFPARLMASLGALRQTISRANAVTYYYPAMSPDIRHQLVGRFEPDIAYVEQMLQVNLDAWRTS